MANPTLNDRSLQPSLEISDDNHVMTINGTILKTCLLGFLMFITFAYTWYLQLTGFGDKAVMLYQGGIFGGLILAIFICFAPKNKSLIITTPLYALCEGLVLGYFSAYVNKIIPGVASQAALGTMFALFGMFFLYKTGMVKATDKFRMVIINSTFAIFGIYLVQFILGFFNIVIPQIFSNSPIGIGFSVLIVAIASFNLIIDFDNIETFSNKVNKNYEWLSLIHI